MGGHEREIAWECSRAVSIGVCAVAERPVRSRQRRTMSGSRKLQKPDDRLLIDWAYALECAGKPDEAVAKVREAIKTQPSAHGYAVIGMIYGKQGRAEEALEALNSAEKADPNFDMTYVYRGNVYAGRGQMAEAATEYRRALRSMRTMWRRSRVSRWRRLPAR